jgi:hypothetical protein
MLTFVNQARLNTHKTLLGAANKWLYAQPQGAFEQIDHASNNCTEYMCCGTGFASTTAVPWNAVTGFGAIRNLGTLLP